MHKRQSFPISAMALALLASAAMIEVPQAFAADVSGSVTMRGSRSSGDVVVYLEKEGLSVTPPVKPLVLDQQELIFVPHVLPLVVGTTVEFPNNDKVRHNVFAPRKSAKRFNLGTYGPGDTRSETFDKPGIVSLLCNVHSEMSAYLVVLETPYFATTDRSGAFSIKNVPPGQYTLKTWHERSKGLEQPLTVESGGVSDLSLQMKGRR